MYVCLEQGHTLIGFLRHSINTADKENWFAFPDAFPSVRLIRGYVSDAGCFCVPWGPESEVSKLGKSQMLLQHINISPR